MTDYWKAIDAYVATHMKEIKLLKLSQENEQDHIPALNGFKLGDKVVADMCAEHDRFEGVVVGIELTRLHGSEYMAPSITLLENGALTDGFKPDGLRKIEEEIPDCADPYRDPSQPEPAGELCDVCSEIAKIDARMAEINKLLNEPRADWMRPLEDEFTFHRGQLQVLKSLSAVEPVRYQRQTCDGWLEVDAEDIPHYRGRGQSIRALYAAPSPSVPVTAQDISWTSGDKLTPDEAWTILCETPDITSPEEYPDHALITAEQLRGFMERAVPSQTEEPVIPVECRASISGSTVSIEIEGTTDQIDAAISEIEGRYPSPAYGTWFNWPPGLLFTSGEKKGQPNTHLAPSDIGGGRWIARGNRSRSSD